MKNYLIILAFTCLTAPSFAQFSIGLSAGPNMTFWKWPLPELGIDNLYDPAMGWRAAALGTWQMSPMFALRVEAGAQVKANKTEITFEDGNATGTGRNYFQYWDGSLLVQVSPVKKIREVYVLAGCTAGKLAKGWRTVTGGTFEGNERKRSIDVDDPYYKSNSIAADLGLGGIVPLSSRGSLKIEGRFQYGLSKFADTDLVDTRVSPLQLNFAYVYRL